MKILNTEQLSEKLNIQPVTKDRLKNRVIPYATANEMRANFITGDLSFMGHIEHVHLGVFISKEDIEEELYDKYFGFNIPLCKTKFYKEGMFIFYDTIPTIIIKENPHFTRTNLADLDSNLMRGEKYGVWEVRRMPFLKLPLDEEYFKNAPTYKAKTIWKRNGL